MRTHVNCYYGLIFTLDEKMDSHTCKCGANVVQIPHFFTFDHICTDANNEYTSHLICVAQRVNATFANTFTPYGNTM